MFSQSLLFRQAAENAFKFSIPQSECPWFLETIQLCGSFELFHLLHCIQVELWAPWHMVPKLIAAVPPRPILKLSLIEWTPKQGVYKWRSPCVAPLTKKHRQATKSVKTTQILSDSQDTIGSQVHLSTKHMESIPSSPVILFPAHRSPSSPWLSPTSTNI
jgi:hypothetical protein